ncbi:MAG: hypothetical protein OXD37_01135 [Acidimicrobiaceae bacterium]|nr:hypothetical protein [Acidimicrobiaceae bacterium]
MDTPIHRNPMTPEPTPMLDSITDHCCIYLTTRGERSVRREAGLTSLEWLLIVAAVAGLAAVSVVIINNVIADTGERVRSGDPRQKAADLSVTSLAERWEKETPASQQEADDINRRYRNRCLQLGVIYSDISLTAEAYEGTYTGGHGWGPLGKHKPSCHIY